MKMYFNFATNIPNTVNDLSTVQVEAITFKHKGGETIDIRLWGEADYGVENGRYDARWKGLEFQSDLINENNISDEDIPEAVYIKLFEYLEESSPCSIAYYWDDASPDDLKYWNVPCEDFTPTCENLSITIEFGDSEKTWICNKL